jgi:hypothetical protein
MATTTISIAADVHERLCKLRLRPEESFSPVPRRELADPFEACGELLDHFAKVGVPRANPKLRQALAQGRGRRSRRDR